jgi:DNA-binding CsgD family transcriptional regulator
MRSETEQLQWKTEGLPNDELSIENAIIIKTVNFHVLNDVYNYVLGIPTSTNY